MLTPEDQAHLKTLSICWYVWAGFALIGILCGGIYAAMGVVFAFAEPASGQDDPEVFGVMFIIFGMLALLISAVVGVLNLMVGRGLAQRRRKVLIYVMAAIACASVPLGTVLGVFTFIVMGRPTVKAAFENPPAQAAS